MKEELFTYLLGVFTTIFSVVNPLGMIPVFLSLTANDDSKYRALLAKKSSIYMILILSFFLMLGNFIMDFFGISLISLRIAGGIIVLRSGFDLLNNTKNKRAISRQLEAEAIVKQDISLTPLAMPLLSGPGSIAAIVSMASRKIDFRFRSTLPMSDANIAIVLILVAIVACGIISYLIMRSSAKILPLLGTAGLEAISKIMGFITMTVGVQFILNGITGYLSKYHFIH